MKRNILNIIIVLTIVFAAGAILWLKAEHKNDAPPPVQAHVEGQASPDEMIRKPTLIDLGADKCIPCKMMAPILEEMRTNYADRLNVVFHDVWENPEAAEQYDIRVIPTQIFLDPEGTELWRHEGFLARQDILTRWAELGYDMEETSKDLP
jgi:thioredoxin 1